MPKKYRAPFIITSGLENYMFLDQPHMHTLTNYFKMMESGSDKVITRPLYKDTPYGDVIDAGFETCRRYGLDASDAEVPELGQFETDMGSKTGPTSIKLPYAQLLPGDKEYWTIPSSVKPEYISLDDLTATVNVFQKARNTKFYSVNKTLEDMTLDSSSGAPYGVRRSRGLQLLRLSLIRARQDLEAYIEVGRWCPIPGTESTAHVEGEWKDGAAVRGHRSQEGSGTFFGGQSGSPLSSFISKQRTVFAMPMDINGLELFGYKPLIVAMQKHGLIPAYCCQEEVDKCVTALFVTKDKDDVVIATDFTKFDHTFGPALQHAARFILEHLLSPSNYRLGQGGINHVFPVKFNIPLICNHSCVIHGQHGMASGSGGTNMDESLAHKALQVKCAREHGQKLNPYSMAYGDDGVLTFPGISIDKVLESYQPVGVTMNKSKQMIDKHCTVVLRRLYCDKYLVNGIMVPLYSTFRALFKCMFKERGTNPKLYGPNEVRLTGLSLCELVKYHPLFEVFTDFILAGTSDRLGLDIPGGIQSVIGGADANPDKVNATVNYSLRSDNRKLSKRKYPTFGKDTTVTDRFNSLTKGYFFDRETADPAAGIRNGRVVQYLLEREKREKAGNPDLGFRAVSVVQRKTDKTA